MCFFSRLFRFFSVCETACCAPVRFSLRSSLSLPLHRRPLSISIEEGRPRTREGGDFEFVFVFLRYIRTGKRKGTASGLGNVGHSKDGREEKNSPLSFPIYFSITLGRRLLSAVSLPPSIPPAPPTFIFLHIDPDFPNRSAICRRRRIPPNKNSAGLGSTRSPD